MKKNILFLFLLTTLMVGVGIVGANSLYMVTPANSEMISGTNYEFNVTVDNEENVTKIIFYATHLDGTEIILGNSENLTANNTYFNLTISTTGLQDGTFSVKAAAFSNITGDNDPVGNSTASTGVIINNTSPTFTFNPATGSKLDKTTVTVTSTEEVSAVTLYFDSNAKTMSVTDTNKTIWTYTTTETLPDKTYNTVYALGTDTDGTTIASTNIKYAVEHASGTSPGTTQPITTTNPTTMPNIPPSPLKESNRGTIMGITAVGLIVISLVIYGLAKLFGKKRR
jgi:hypothetical protein